MTGALNVASITQYLFWIATVAMGAGTVFFFLERSSVDPKYRSVMTVAGLVCGIACFHYFRMSATYAGGDFPTEYRYIDWIITTPLLLIKFPLLLRLGAAGKSLIAQLVILDLVMIVTAYIAEVSAPGSGRWWSFFIIACLAEFGIVGLLYLKMSDTIARAPAPIARSARTMRLFILIGWAIYPIGFLMALSGSFGGDLREIFYNIADVINKVGFGLVAYAGIKALSEADRTSSSAPATATA
jgi:bacteriorhodopsin